MTEAAQGKVVIANGDGTSSFSSNIGSTTAVNSISGSLAFTTRTASSNFTVDTTTTDYYIFCDTTSNAFSITLPAPTNGRTLVFKDIKQNFATNSLTIIRHGGESIDGVAGSLILSTTNQEVVLQSDGTNWYTNNFLQPNAIVSNPTWLVANWFIDPANGFDGYTGQNSTFVSGAIGPLKTWHELTRRWGTISPHLRQTTTITFVSSHTDNTDPIYFRPFIENGSQVIIQGTLGTPVATGTIPNDGNFHLKNRTTGQLLQATLSGGLSVGQFIINNSTTSCAFLYNNVSGNTWTISQPITLQTLSSINNQPPQATWATGNSYSIYNLTRVNIVEFSPMFSDMTNRKFGTLYQLSVYDPGGTGSNFCTIGGVGMMAVVECQVQRQLAWNSPFDIFIPGAFNCDLVKGAQSNTNSALLLAFSIVAGQMRGGSNAGSCSIDGDTIVGSFTVMNFSIYGSLYIDTGASILFSGSTCIGSSAYTPSNNGIIWGPGSIDVFGGSTQLTYSSTAVSSFPLTGGITIGGLSDASAYNPAGIGTFVSSISITAANIDLAISSGGFGGTAIVPGGGSITNQLDQTPTGTLSFLSTITAPIFTQTTTSSGSGQAMTVQAQGATGATHNGGNLVLSSGTSGSATVGQVQIQAGGITIAKVDGYKFYEVKGFNVNITPITGSYNVLATDNFIAVGVISSPITITLPSGPATGDTYSIKDTRGSAQANNITISGNGNNIDGASSFVIAINFTFMTLVFTGTYWSVC